MDQKNPTINRYIAGFALSLLFTISAYIVVIRHTLGGSALFILLGGLAIAQFLAQLVLFLHLGHEAKPRWKVWVFYFMVMIAAILIFGSLWIMSSLNYHMSPHDVTNYLHRQDGL